MKESDLKPGDVTTLGELRPGDVGEFEGIYTAPFVMTESGRCEWPDGSWRWFSPEIPVIYRGRGKIVPPVPARIVMRDEPDPLSALRELEDWKASQLKVESEWDEQKVGRLLNVPLGQSIRAAIQPGIEKLQQRVAELDGQVGELRDALVQAAIPLEAINGSVSWELCKPLQESVSVAVKILRSTLARETE